MFLYGLRWLRYHEFIEFGASVASVLFNARSHVRTKIRAGEVAGKLHEASSLDELKAMLNASAETLGVEEVALIQGSPRFNGPEVRRLSPKSERLFRVDYPIAWERNGQVHEVVLRVWCERPTALHHVGAERIAARLAPAIESWLSSNATGMPAQEPQVPRQAPKPRVRSVTPLQAGMQKIASRLEPKIDSWLETNPAVLAIERHQRAAGGNGGPRRD
jgi:hypothetical protein